MASWQEWEEWEERIINDWIGLRSSRYILDTINRQRKSEGLSPRTYYSLVHKSRAMGFSSVAVLGSDYQTLGAWANELGLPTENLRYYYHRTFPDAPRRKPGENTRRNYSKSEIGRVLRKYPALSRQCDQAALQNLEMGSYIAEMTAN